MKPLLLAFLLPLTLFAQTNTSQELNDWEQRSKRVTIIRDDWAVPHVYGKKDADVVFGLMYAQCEDNYWQFEETFIGKLGRYTEIYGERGLENDWAIAAYQTKPRSQAVYASADPFIKELCDAAAAGINYYLEKHPTIERRLIRRYEPWYFLLPEFRSPASHGITRQEMLNVIKESSIGESEEDELQQLESGSNTMAIAPTRSASGKTMLLINPHVGLFGNGQRYECHLISDEGLNVSGFAIFGDYWIWSGFNANVGWAHTNSGVDFIDVFLEKFDHPTDTLMYRYGDTYKRAKIVTNTILYKSDSTIIEKVFNFITTDRGPVVAKRGDFYVTVKISTGSQPDYITQCWRKMRATNLKEFQSAMDTRAIAYPNTMYADRNGNIAYWHGNAVAKRSLNFDWSKPVDGSNPETDWKELHALNEIVHTINPTSGWIQNCNSSPFLCAGPGSSPDSLRYPKYMANDPQNFRSEEAIRLLSSQSKISFDRFQQMVVSTHLPMMQHWVPQILKAYDHSSDNALREKLKTVTDTLRRWNYAATTDSKAMTLVGGWSNAALGWVRKNKFSTSTYLRGEKLPYPDSLALSFLVSSVDTLQKIFGTPFVSWGEINRLQRVHTSGSLEKFEDEKISIPVKGAPSSMGALFAFGVSQPRGSKRGYGTFGNTYVATIEFGKKVRAKSIMYFGQSADPTSPHYFDQAPLYSQGKLKDVYFYKRDVLKHAQRTYHPGEEIITVTQRF
jgi:acyl-homoserine-lactone acylase